MFCSAGTWFGGGDKAIEEGVRLMTDSELRDPTATFELRFDEAVSGALGEGLKAAGSPLVITPSLRGEFKWLSSRSGVFTPAEPPALGTAYRLTLRRGLQGADGKPLRARLNRTLTTPPFEIVRVSPRRFVVCDAPSQFTIRLRFNAEVDPQTAAKFVFFRNGKGQRLKAKVTRGRPASRYSDYEDVYEKDVTWKDRFYRKGGAIADEPVDSEEDDEGEDGKSLPPIPSMLQVAPEPCLPLGEDWRLIVQSGLPSAGGTWTTRKDFEVAIGNVNPFEVIKCQTSNVIGHGRNLELRWSKALDPDLTSTNMAQWVAVTPMPSNLVISLNCRDLTLRGDFQLDRRYHVEVKKGVPSSEPFTQVKTYTNAVTFAPVAPRLYFPAFSKPQLRFGQRRFDVLGINVPEVGIRAKKLDRSTLIHALRGYERYRKDWNETNDGLEPFREIDFNGVPGGTIYERRFSVDAPMDQTSRISLQWDEILGKNKPGAVFLAAEQPADRHARLGTEAVVQVTDLGVMLKRGKGGAWVYVFSHSTGRALAGVSVRVCTAENKAVEEAVTNAEGLVRLGKPYYQHWLMLERGEDLFAMHIGGDYLSPYGFDLPVDWCGNDREKCRVLMFSDRDVYRPGEIMHLKAIARVWADDQLRTPSSMKGKLTVIDPRDNAFFTRDVQLTARGSLSEAVPMPDGKLGHYRAELKLEDQTFCHYFQVQQFEPSPFEIKIKAQASYAAGEKVSVPVAAKYYMGKALSKARLKWSVRARDEGFHPANFDDYVFCSDGSHNLSRLGRVSGSMALNHEDALSGGGTSLIEPHVALNAQLPQPRLCKLLVEVTDVNQKTVSESAGFVCHSSAFYLGLRRFKDVAREGDALPIELVAVKPDGSPWPEAVNATVAFTRVDWQTVRVKGAGGGAGYRQDYSLVPCGEIAAQTCRLVPQGSRWEIPKNAAPLSQWRPERPGLYLVEIKARDFNQREVVTAATVNICGKGEATWSYRNAAQLELVPDKISYCEGDTATLLVKTPLNGMACVAVERENVMRFFTRQISGKAPVLKIPLGKGSAPNVFVSVVLIRGAAESTHRFKQPEYRYGYCQLNVLQPEARLRVALQPDSSDYRPGQTVNVKLQVRDARGQPAPGAEVTCYAVDEGILALTGYRTPDPFGFFHAIRPLGVNTILSLPTLFPENPEEWSFDNKGYLVGGGGDEGAVSLRKKFLPCAFWDATLRADAAGCARVRFVAPDSLTRYRLIAVAHTPRQQFGSGESRFEINKPLMLEPALPRFANMGDQLAVRAVLHNQTDLAGDVEVKLELDDKAVPQNGGAKPAEQASRAMTRSLKLAARQSASVDFPVEFRDAGMAAWVWRARMLGQPGNRMTDAVETRLQVGYPVPLLRETLVGRSKESSTNLIQGANPQILEGQHGQAAVRISNTRLVELGEALQHLLKYPYGCVEQTTSSLMPWIALKDARDCFPELQKSPGQFDAAIQRGINRLLAMQTESGGLSYWPGGRTPMFWGSAYGGLALALAQKNGHLVPLSSMGRLAHYLSEQLRDAAKTQAVSEMQPRCLALFALALAGKAEPAYHEVLFQKRHLLSAENRALLALAVLECKGDAKMADELLSGRVSRPAEEELWFGCGAREIAIRLLAWSRHRPKDRVVDVLVEELMQARRQAHWQTTQGNAWALLGLTEYARRVEGERQSVKGTLVWGRIEKAFAVGGKQPVAQNVFAIARDTVSQPLQLLNPQQGRIFTQVQLEARPQLWQQPRQDRGLGIRREYALVEDDGSVKELGTPRVGDRVLVTLRIETRNVCHYVAVEDPMPANLEALNPEFKTQATRAGENLGMAWFGDYHELREDRALFFRDHLPAGQYTIRYLARVRAAGTATAPSAKIEEMYHPERFGMSGTETVKTRSLD